MAEDENQSGESGEQEKPEDRANRMNAAKAFYRAMYAGEDVVPDDFGMSDSKGGGGGGGSGGGGGGDRGGPCPNCTRMEAQLAEAEKTKTEAEGFYKRIAADFENYRRRTEKEKEEFLGLGIQKAIEQILPALDDMDRARQSLATVTDPKAILDSLNLVFTRFTKCLEAAGVKQLEAIGEPFDPRMHEPVQEIETNEFADGHVVHELRRGYVYKDKVLRPTLVNVASNPSGVVVPKKAPEVAAAAETPAEAQPADQATSAPNAAPAEAAPAEAASAEAAPAAAESANPQSEQHSAHPKAEKTEPPAKKKALDKLKPTARPHTETADLPIFKVEDYDAGSLHPPSDEAGNESKEGGTVYDISDVDG